MQVDVVDQNKQLVIPECHTITNAVKSSVPVNGLLSCQIYLFQQMSPIQDTCTVVFFLKASYSNSAL